MKTVNEMRLWLDDRVLRKRVQDKSFSIISNNCWGGVLCQQLDMPYTSPFAGLFLYPPCFLKMLENLREYIESPLRFIDESRYHMANEMRSISAPYPIGVIGPDIELHFIHYPDSSEATSKWKRRCQRINWDNLRIVFIERELSTLQLIERFDALDYRHKVCFSSKCLSLSSVVWIKECRDWPYVTDLMKYRFLYKQRFDVADWLNGGTGRPSIPYRIMESILCPRKKIRPFQPLPGYTA